MDIYFQLGLQGVLFWLLLEYRCCSGVSPSGKVRGPGSPKPGNWNGSRNLQNCTASNLRACRDEAESKLVNYLRILTVGNDTYNENFPPPFALHLADTTANSPQKYRPWVKLIMQPLRVTKMSMKLMEFSTSFIAFVTWEDGRFQIPDAKLNNSLPDAIDLTERLRVWRKEPLNLKLWVPNIQFVNCVDNNAALSDPTVELKTIKMTLYPRLQKITTTHKFSQDFFCPYTFTRYPFDKQRCAIQVTYVHSTPLVNFTEEVLMKDMTQIRVPPEFHLMAVSLSSCPDTYSAENYLIECAELVFIFQRIYSQHIMLLFIPSTLIVCLSWISFWLDESAAPPRVALGLTSLLTLATQFSNAQKDLPAVAEIKAIDIWMFSCMIMVFSSLMEFCIVNYTHRKFNNPAPVKIHSELTKISIPRYVYSVPEKSKFAKQHGKRDCLSLNIRSSTPKCCSKAKGNKIDIYSRIIFPLAFLMFNVVFWTYFIE